MNYSLFILNELKLVCVFACAQRTLFSFNYFEVVQDIIFPRSGKFSIIQILMVTLSPFPGKDNIIRVWQVTQRYGITEAVVRYLEPRLITTAVNKNTLSSLLTCRFSLLISPIFYLQTAKSQGLVSDLHPNG